MKHEYIITYSGEKNNSSYRAKLRVLTREPRELQPRTGNIEVRILKVYYSNNHTDCITDVVGNIRLVFVYESFWRWSKVGCKCESTELNL